MSDIKNILRSIGFKQIKSNDWVYRDDNDDIFYRNNRLTYISDGVFIDIADNIEEIQYYLITMLRNKRLKEFNICWN